MYAVLEVLTPFVFRSFMASGEGKNWKTPTEDPASTSARPTEEPPRRWNSNKGMNHTMPCHDCESTLSYEQCKSFYAFTKPYFSVVY